MKYFLVVIIFFSLIFDKLNIFYYLIVSSMIHETGHIIACILSGTKPSVEVSVFGIKLSGYPQANLKKFIVLICGPLVNLIMAVVSKSLLMINFSFDIYIFMIVNLVVFIFNCLPVFFLDGGQIVALFCDSSSIRTMFDLISIVILCVAAVLFSNDITMSAMMLFLFIIYYFINKKTSF